MFKLLVCLVVVVAVCQALVYPKVDDRIQGLISKMNLTEKMSLIAGIEGTYTGNTPAIERLGIPALKMQDGPQGFRTSRETTGGEGTTTAWPSAMTIASSWDVDLVHRWAVAMAEEFSGKGANMALAPGIGIARVPVAGRNFEYLCGEDPILGAKVVQPVIRGLQENGVIADAKHYVNNEIETDRMTVSANVDERTRFELYYPPFQAAVDAGVLTVMCAYNRINDQYACENEDTLNHLREKMGFKGFVVSDWTAAKSTTRSLRNGMDIEMPFGIFYSDKALEDKLSKGEITESEIDRSVSRILYVMDRMGMLDQQYRVRGNPTANVTSDAHNAVAREIAAKSTVLLKNSNGLLPLQVDQLGDCIAVIGDQTTVAGDGSGHVDGPYVITPVDGITQALKKRGSSTQVKYNDGSDPSAAATLAQQCNVAVVSVATTSCEGIDRENLSLTNNQDALISAVAAVNPRTVVAMKIPGAILMPWLESVPAVLSQWMPGQEAGNALADVLFGDVNPSGRLPITMPNKDNEVGFTQEEFPGTGHPPEAQYHEELLIGYRWYDAKGVQPLFPFGHGLSYTTFSYSLPLVHVMTKANAVMSAALLHHQPAVPIAIVKFMLQNTGKVDGAEVAQVYLQYPDVAGEPPKQLRNFAKVDLAAGQRREVVLTLTQRDVAVWDATTHDWKVHPGTYTVHIGASSRDIRLQTSFDL